MISEGGLNCGHRGRPRECYGHRHTSDTPWTLLFDGSSAGFITSPKAFMKQVLTLFTALTTKALLEKPVVEETTFEDPEHDNEKRN